VMKPENLSGIESKISFGGEDVTVEGGAPRCLKRLGVHKVF